MLWRVLHSICQQIWKTQEWPQSWKRSVFISVLKKVNAKECAKLPHNCTHLTCYQSNAQNSLSQASTVHELCTSRCSRWIYKRQKNQMSNCQHLLDHRQSKRVPENHLFLLYWLYQSLCWVDHNKLWKILQETGISDHLTCLLRNLYAAQEATDRTDHATTDWFLNGKGVYQGCILSTCLSK